MKKKFDFTYDEINVLEYIAHISKMDCWFAINDDGYCIDLEANNMKLPAPMAVKHLVDGMTKEDFEMLTTDQNYTLANLLLKFIKEKNYGIVLY